MEIDDNKKQLIFEKVIEMSKGHQIAVLIIGGSRLYGASNENSDIDIKGVTIPTKNEVYLGRHKKSIVFGSSKDGEKNSKDDIDIELYSLHSFFELLKKGDSSAISMINAPSDKILSRHSPTWDMIVENSGLFYSKKMTGVLGYARKQANKYGVKGIRLQSAKDACDFLKQYDVDMRLKDVWDSLPDGEFLFVHKEGYNVFWSVCGRLIQDTSKIGYALDIVEKVIDAYGHRSRKAMSNDGLDWKAISHAYRAAYELIDIYTFGKIQYPLKNADKIISVKNGDLDFKNDVSEEISLLMDRVEKLGIESDFLPDDINVEKVDNLLISILGFIL